MCMCVLLAIRIPILAETGCHPFVDSPPISVCAILGMGGLRGDPIATAFTTHLLLTESLKSIMVHISLREWQIASLAAAVAVAAGTALWYVSRKRPTEEELERERRQSLISFGRIVDGSLLDGFQITAEDGTTRDMLLYQYEISGVVYECSQDITPLAGILDPATVKVGMPCSIRYQPGSPENSILVAERWSGLREGVPVLWSNPKTKRSPEDQWQRLRPASGQSAHEIRSIQ
jgi:hypothetical protein